MNKYTMNELNGRQYSVEDYLKQRDLFPQHDIVLVGDFLRDITIEELKKYYRTLKGSFYIYEEDDGEWEGKRIIRPALWFMVKEEE